MKSPNTRTDTGLESGEMGLGVLLFGSCSALPQHVGTSSLRSHLCGAWLSLCGEPDKHEVNKSAEYRSWQTRNLQLPTFKG
ncbi:unnamed protein product [Sphagnum tenellum]